MSNSPCLGADDSIDGRRPFDENIALGVLDLCKAVRGASPAKSIETILETAIACEGFGFRRFWLGEHHTPDAALSCPELLVPLIARATRNIRVGPGGILLSYHSPRRVAELAFGLAALVPGRLDFGVCRGPGVSNPLVAAELASGRSEDLSSEGFQAKVRALRPYLQRELGEPGSTALAPTAVGALDFWLLGSSPGSLELALEVKARLAVSILSDGSDIVKSTILDRYHAWRRMKPTGATILAVSMVCSDGQAEAEAQDKKLVEAGFLGANIVGNAERCADQLRQLSRRHDIHEFIVASWVSPPALRLRGYELLAARLLAVPIPTNHGAAK